MGTVSQPTEMIPTMMTGAASINRLNHHGAGSYYDKENETIDDVCSSDLRRIAIDGETIKAKIGNLHKRVATANLGRQLNRGGRMNVDIASGRNLKPKRGSSW